VAGDVITVSMTRSDGDLDPFLRLLNGDLNSLVSDDYSGSTGNANTSGSFILVLARRFD